MATVIKIKNTNLDKAPVDGNGDSVLATGELAYSYFLGAQNNNGDRIYIGTGTETNGLSADIAVIGGKYFTDMLDHVHGTLTASSGVIVDANKKIDEWRVDNLVLDGNTISVDQTSNANGNINIIPGGTTGEVVISAFETTINGLFTVSGNQTFTGDLDVTGNGHITGTLDVDSQVTVASLNVEDLTSTRIVYVGASGELVDDSGFTYTGTGAGGTLQLLGSINVDVEATLASAVIEDLTDNRVLIAGIGGAVEDDGNFTFDGSTLTLGSAGNFTVAQATGNVYAAGTLEVDGQATIASLNVEDLTNNRIVIAGASGEIEDDANFTFDGTELNIGQGKFTTAVATGDTTVAGTINVDGQATLASANVEDLTNNRIVIAGINGELEDDANFTFDGTNFKVGTTTTDKFVVAQATGNTNIAGTLDVTGNVTYAGTMDVDGQLTAASVNVEDLTASRVVFVGANGELVDDTNFTFNSTTDKLSLVGSAQIDQIIIDGNDIATSTGSMTITPAAQAETIINTTSALRLPVGNSTERPSTPATGQIRFNTTTSQYEGYSSGAWQGLGGVIDVDQNTYIIAQPTPNLVVPGTTADTLYFVTGGIQTASMDTATGLTVNNVNIADNTVSTTTGDLYLDPGQTGAGSPTGNVVVYGNLNVMGTTTTIDSTTITVDDPVFTLGGDTPATADDNKDRGIEFRWHDGTSAKTGFFGYDDSAERFKFIADATNVSEVFSGAASDVEFGNALIDSMTFSATNFTANSVPWVDANGDVGFLDEDATSPYGTEGQVIQMNTSGVPVFGHIDCGTY
jgi:hypothetical protein